MWFPVYGGIVKSTENIARAFISFLHDTGYPPCDWGLDAVLMFPIASRFPDGELVGGGGS